MNKKLNMLVLTGALTCAMVLPAMASETGSVPISAPVSAGETVSLPDSVLYYGTVQGIVKGENGAIKQLRLSSERYGEYIMNVTDQTVWVDSGRHTASNPAELQEGEGVYVFHSVVETSSLPPQSTAFAVVRNIPMDAGCAQYHEVEAIEREADQLKITTDNGGLYILADENTKLSIYGSDQAASFEDIQVGGYVMAWYEGYTAVYPGQTQATHIMVLPSEENAKEEMLTRSQLVMMMYEQAGKPEVDSLVEYSDIVENAEYAEAVRWATSEGLVGGYDNGTFGPENIVNREQMITILWRYANSPMLMDYPGLTQFEDVEKISLFAQPAFAWAHQKGYLSDTQNNMLDPYGVANRELAERILNDLSGK